jgi:hypothetical protein
MLLGPVFRAELIRTSRRRRYYVLRVVYGIALLVLVWMKYMGLISRAEVRGGRPLISDVAEFALSTFLAFAVLQLATILVIVPALFGGVIADEKQRKTIHYLMASRLTSAEIVLDKLLARLLYVGVFVQLGLPVICLMSLFGGIPWEYVAAAYAGTCSITFFAAALATLVSTFARRVGQGVLITYLLLFAWLIGPALADVSCRFVYPVSYVWFKPINDWLLATSPSFFPFGNISMGMGLRLGARPLGPAALLDPFLWMVGLQCALGIVFLLIAVCQLRPTFRRQASSSRWLSWFGREHRGPRWLRRPACGADAMLWKERHFARTDVFTKLVVLPATIILTVFLALMGEFDEKVVGAFKELIHHGYSVAAHWGSREALNAILRDISPFYIGLWLLAVAGASASSVTAEREEDSWISLISTPLTGWEILRGKMVGAVWGLRGFGGLLGLAWLAGLVLGAVHPLGLLLALLVVGLLTWFVAALGVSVALTVRTTSRAMTSVIGYLVFLNGGYLVVLVAIILFFDDPTTWGYRYVGCTPLLASGALLSFGDIKEIVRLARGPGLLADPVRFRFAAYALCVLTGYAVATVLLTWRSVRRFDTVVDRPRREPDALDYRPSKMPSVPPRDEADSVLLTAGARAECDLAE